MVREGREAGNVVEVTKKLRARQQREIRIRRNLVLRREISEVERRARRGEKGGLVGLLEGMGNYRKRKAVGRERG